MARYNDQTGHYRTVNLGRSSGDAARGGDVELSAGRSDQNGREYPTAIFNPFYTGRPRTPANGAKHVPIDRQEIIRRIKSRESRPSSPEIERTSGDGAGRRSSTPPSTVAAPLGTPYEQPQTLERQISNETAGMQIERPRSALHRGDFREKADKGLAFRFDDAHREESAPSLSTSPVAPWHANFPAAIFRQAKQERPSPPSSPGFPLQKPSRTRATSHASLASNFVYKPPTSPLVQSSRPDTPEPNARRASRSPDKSRRHTFSPPSLQHHRSALEYPTSARTQNNSRTPLRAERTFPYQAHQPRRSLNHFSSLPQTPTPGTRRPSFAEASLHHAPMVGSYEESILRGRMSTTPSKPLNFVAQIGVLGKGDCKPNLRCPPHASVPFPAVFYSYASAARVTDQPSPYVGLVDLENHLTTLETAPGKRRQSLRRGLSEEGSRASSRNRDDGSSSDAKARRRRRQKQKRRSGSPKAPPCGSYRIPQQGQLQIIIKNPNKTAVKLFLIPYDLSDMEPGQKTFIRQRSYSAGPIIDMPLASRRNLGTDRPEASLSASDDPNDRPTLRYLIHLHICCPSKGRYFLYKSIRVVFANRVPDGKERLRNEIQLPAPKYSTYKPGRDSNAGFGGSATVGNDAARGLNAQGSSMSPPLEQPPWLQNGHFAAQSLPSLDLSRGYSMPTQPYPLEPSLISPMDSRPASRQLSDGIDDDSGSGSRSALSSLTSDGQGMAHNTLRLLDDAFAFERDRSRERQPEVQGESLLSRSLRDLAFRTNNTGYRT